MRVRASYDEGAFEVYGAETAVLLDAKAYRFGDSIKAKVVLCRVDFSQEFALKLFELHLVNGAFEDGFLYALADPFAGFGDAAQAVSVETS